jgi:hypothetical protein
MHIDWHQSFAAVWREYNQQLKPITRLDPVSLDELKGIDKQKQAIVENTVHFLAGKPSNHALLWGARGTGKSSLIKAVLNEFASHGLRMIQLETASLHHLPEILDKLEALPFHFVIYCDDLSFEAGESEYKPLKTLLEGGLECPLENVRLYASSNRRHLMPETHHENQLSKVVDEELHLSESLEDKLALSDRFGLNLSFYPAGWDNYFAIVSSLFAGYPVDEQTLHEAARLYAMSRGLHSGRTAKQFYQSYAAKLDQD